MIKNLCSGLALLLSAVTAFAAPAMVTAMQGTVQKIDAAAKTVVVKTADGAEHTFHFVGRTTVHGAEKTADGAQAAFHGLKEGSEVVVHYTAKGADATAEEVDQVGHTGMKATEGTISEVGRGGKTIAVRAADGTVETYRLAGGAAKEAGKEIAAGTEKSAKVTVYYTEEGGHKVAHFVKKVI